MQIFILQGPENVKPDKALVNKLYPVILVGVIDWLSCHGYKDS